MVQLKSKPENLRAVAPSADTGTSPVAPRDEADRRYVEVSGVGHSYSRNGPTVLRSIDLKISAGEIVALIGRSGSGKSTLLHIISGLMKPSDGAVRIDGQRVEKPSPRWVMMFQAPSLYPWMTVAQNAGLGLKYAKKTEGVDARVKEVLSLVDLAEFADRNVQDLSGGQQQRAAFARSIAPEPELLLLDEPFSALDIFTRRALQNDVREIAKRLGLTVVLVTHDVNEAVQMADRAVLLSSGPGRIAGDTEINVSEADRVSQSKKFQMETTRLRTLYTEIAGLG
ncbi:ABC transporter ATP-binding protein [Aliishimia ponticola]|uniref:ABC transporter ATP-binding protein n=1 Tax=Aliishimia ponticola TaxID=2499833 RepID=A0A4S4NDX7_9RHOB|nr:ABC transporter ATP-binding protein [Aliishimia ponticola]